MTNETARNLCTKNSPDTLATYLSRQQLVECFRALYDIEPRKTISKLDLAYSCQSYIEDEIRTADLCKILY